MRIWTARSLAPSALALLSALALTALLTRASFAGAASGNEIDASIWGVIADTVAAGDIDGMATTYHPDAVLVSRKGTVAIAAQLLKWGEGMEQARLEGTSASVSFRFESRRDDDETAFERGIFRYVETDKNGLEEPVFVPFEALLVKKDGSWLILMERQLAATDESAWDALGREAGR